MAKRGPRKTLEYFERLDIAHDYITERDLARERRLLKLPAPGYLAVRKKVADEHSTTARMVKRCYDELGPKLRRGNSELRWRKKFK